MRYFDSPSFNSVLTFPFFIIPAAIYKYMLESFSLSQCSESSRDNIDFHLVDFSMSYSVDLISLGCKMSLLVD